MKKKISYQNSVTIVIISILLLYSSFSGAQPEYCTTGLYYTDYGNNPCQYNSAIDNFSLSDLNQTATGCSMGFADYTSTTINLSRGESYRFTATSTSFYTYSEYLGIWIDFNDNYSFDDAGEFIFSSLKGGELTGIITISGTVPTGNHRMRIRLKNDYSGPFTSTDACTFYYQGEAQDYTVNIGNAPDCSMVKDVTISEITLNSSKVNWNCIDCTGSFIVEYGLKGFTPGTGTILNIADYSAVPVTINGLSSSTDYDVYIKRNCGANGFSSNYPVISFTTLYNMCATLTNIDCGQQVNAVILPGDGVINNIYSGTELLYQFTPSKSGVYTITSLNYASVSFYIKKASSGCNTEGLEPLVTSSFGTSILDTLEADVSYYLIVDGISKDYTTYYSFKISCYEPSAPCENIIQATCGEEISVTIPIGAGEFHENAGFTNYFGKERIISFKPEKTGVYTLQTLPVSYEDLSVGFSYKKASDGCNPFGWHFIQNGIQHNGRYDLIGTLIGGVEYYILIDAYSIGGARRSVIINCLDATDPCDNDNIEKINCGTNITYEVPPGIGTFVPDVCLNNSQTSYKIGREKIFEFTPSTSGRAALWLKSHTFDLYENFYFKEASSGCNNNNWQCIKYLNSGEKVLLPGILTAGTTYYLMADVWGIGGGAITFEITCPEDYDPCATITSISCGNPVSANLPAGIGKYSIYEGEESNYYGGVDGKEVIYSFKPTTSGTHQITVTETDYKPPLYEWKHVTYYIKDSADGCNGNGWSFIRSFVMPPYQWDPPVYLPYPLIAGHTYYIMLDGAIDGANQTFEITCPELTYPCDNIVTGISCDTEYSFSNPSGLGQFNPLPAYNSYTLYGGKESLFEFKPNITGSYELQIVSSSDYSNIGYFIKEAADGCNNNNWKIISSYSLFPGQKVTIPITLIAGTSYFIRADGTTNGTTFKLICPSTLYDPCSVITPIPDCNYSIRSLNNPGLGQYPKLININDGFSSGTPGKELIFSFKPDYDGVFGLKVEAGGSGQLSYFIKEASEDCNASGWQLIGSEYYGYGFHAKIPLKLKAGVTYYILTDAITTDGADQTFKITCPTEDVCNSITEISACGWQNDIQALIPPGINSIMLNPCFSVNPKLDGGAAMFSFSPAQSGYYSITTYNGNYYNQNFFVKESSTGCIDTGWICMQTNYWDTYYNPFPLIEGHTYYFLVVNVYPSDETTNLRFWLNCTSGIVQYADKDGDGYGNHKEPLYDYILPLFGYVYDNTDCNDNAASAYPGAKEICGNEIDDDCDGLIDEDCCDITVDAGKDVITYYGYPSLETVTRTVKVTGGTAPFSYKWTLNRTLICNNINADGDETFTSGNCTNNSCPTSGGLSINPECNGNATITAKLMTTATVCITVTDANGCTASDCFEVNANDVRCYSKDKLTTKVLVCHKTGNPKNPWTTICVDKSMVNYHLSHGDYPGSCTTTLTTNTDRPIVNQKPLILPQTLTVKAWPNPSNSRFTLNISSNSIDNVQINVMDISGKSVLKMSGASNKSYSFGAELRSGIYIAEITQGAERRIIKLIKQ